MVKYVGIDIGVPNFHLGGGDVSDVLDDLYGQIPNVLIFVYVQANNRIHSYTHNTRIYIHTYIHTTLYRRYTAPLLSKIILRLM